MFSSKRKRQAKWDRYREWQKRSDAARNEWGSFGEKKRWMDKHPKATEADWKAYDKKRLEEWKKRNPRPETVDSHTDNRKDGSKYVQKPASGKQRVMNTLILNRDTFQMPEDGWYQIAPLGEFPHQPTGVVQIVDKDACDAMTNAFKEESGKANFAGLLIDFDHFSLDDKLKSEAAGWIVALENRDPASSPPGTTPGQGGLWAKIRWSDVGEDAVKGGRYRFLSPVWSRRDCDDLGNGRLRPVRLLNAAVTNDPNLKGMVPLSNRAESGKQKAEMGARGQGQKTEGGQDLLPNAAGEQRFKWVLGSSPDERHCPSCEALAGQVHTQAEWDSLGLKPGGESLYCQDGCHCRLVETDGTGTGSHTAVPLRKPAEEDGDALSNAGWSDEARAASLAVRRAKAAARKAGRAAEAGDGGTENTEKKPKSSSPIDSFKEEGLSGMAPEDVDRLTGEIRDKMNEGEKLTPAEEDFLQERLNDGYAGESDDDPIFEWAERSSTEDTERTREQRENSVEGIAARAEELMTREGKGETLSSAESQFLDRYLEIVRNRGRGPEDRSQRAEVGDPWTGDGEFREKNAEVSKGDALQNAGWSDEARRASLAVRKAKAAARRAGESLAPRRWPTKATPPGPSSPTAPTEPTLVPIDDGGMIWPGGSPYFDEGTGQYDYPAPQPPMAIPVAPRTPGYPPYPTMPQQMDPRAWRYPGLPTQGIPPDAQTLVGSDGGFGDPGEIARQVDADKMRRRLVMQGYG